MTVWITRYDHMPVEWLVDYSAGEYPLVIIPSLFGKLMQHYPDREPESVQALTAYVMQLHSAGFAVCGSQWGVAEDPMGEADAAHGLITAVEDACQARGGSGFDGWVMNGEKRYEGGNKSASYAMRFREWRPRFPLAWTPEIRLSLDHNILQQKGVFYLPQVYVAEQPWQTVQYAVDWAMNFGYEKKNVGIMCQAYTTNDVRPSAAAYRDECRRLGIGQAVLYTGNQCLDAFPYWRNLVI